MRRRSSGAWPVLFDEHALPCRLVGCYGGSSTRQNFRQPFNGCQRELLLRAAVAFFKAATASKSSLWCWCYLLTWPTC